MKAAVYNRWLHQKGGGERHSAMAAQVLSERFETELVTHRPISCEELSDALNIDLSNVTVRVIPALPPNRFAAFTRTRRTSLFFLLLHVGACGGGETSWWQRGGSRRNGVSTRGDCSDISTGAIGPAGSQRAHRRAGCSYGTP